MSEELKNSILSKNIDLNQLDQLAGGAADIGQPEPVERRENCQATVEYGSWCGSNDACFAWECDYDLCTLSVADGNV